MPKTEKTAGIEKLIGARVLALKGHTQTEIARTFGVNQSTICRWLKATLDPEILDEIEARKDEPEETVLSDLLGRLTVEPAPLSEDAKVQLSLELERLDEYHREVHASLSKVRDSSKGAHAVARLVEVGLKIQDRRAKYLGLDQPAQVKLSGDAEKPMAFTIEGIDPTLLK